MSGHSKWHNIKIRKTRVDAEKGKVFTKVAREIMMAVRQGGAKLESNFRLRLAIQRAKEVNMPKDSIERAIQKGSGHLIDDEGYEEVIYEGYGPQGVAILIEATTNNRNRTVADLRSIFSRNGGSLGESGCVAWMFQKKGLITFDSKVVSEDEILACVLEEGVEDLRKEDDIIEIVTDPADLERVKEAIETAEYKYISAEVTMLPQNTIKVEKEEAGKVLRLMELLEDHDDVQKVYSNFDIEAKILEELSR